MLTHLLLLSVETTLHGLPVQKLLQALEVIVQDTSHEVGWSLHTRATEFLPDAVGVRLEEWLLVAIA